MKARAHIFISGRVQGVFFRYETQKIAEINDVAGWVRNTLNGKVEAIFEGKKENVENLLEFCKRGPHGARVTNIEVEWENYTGEHKDFRVRYNR